MGVLKSLDARINDVNTLRREGVKKIYIYIYNFLCDLKVKNHNLYLIS